jgi:hypothetical protein
MADVFTPVTTLENLRAAHEAATHTDPGAHGRVAKTEALMHAAAYNGSQQSMPFPGLFGIGPEPGNQ